jgi:photosystem II stability/assembly factor-like uncharacterized protein
MRPHIFLAGLIAGSLLTASPAAASPATWTRIGPEGGALCALAAAPSRPAVVYAGLGRGGVFRSDDRGRTWSFMGRGLPRRGETCSLAVDPVSPATVWTATSIGLFRSVNAGVTWSRIGAPPAGPFVNSPWNVTAHPRRSGVVWVSTGAQLFTTQDGGATWQELKNAPRSVITLAVDPRRPATLYAGTLGKGAFKSTDAGVTWTALHPSPNPLEALFINSFAFDPRDSRTLFLVPTDGGLFKSTDAGANWVASNEGLDHLSLSGVAFDPVNPAVVFASMGGNGIYRSTDGGNLWQPDGAGLPSRNVNALVPTASGVLAGTDLGTALTGDHGATWQTGRGLSATSIDQVAVSPQDPPRIYARNILTVWKTASRGGSWLNITPSLPPGPGPGFFGTASIALAPNSPDTVYAGLLFGFAVSSNGGRRWSPLADLGCVRPDHLVIAPTPLTLYAGGPYGCDPPNDYCTIYRSRDGGQSWSCIKNGLPSFSTMYVLAFDPFAPSHIFTTHLDGFDSGSLYRSTDSGDSWSLFSPDIAALKLVFDPRQRDLVYALTATKVGRSTDGGATWQLSRTGFPPAESPLALVLDPTSIATLYAATAFNVYRSTDAGTTWAPLAHGLEQVTVSDLAIDTADPKILYAATQHGGVMMLDLEPAQE